MMERRTYCRICEAACGLVAEVEDDRVVALRPDRDHPQSRGFVCAKGTRFAEVAYHPSRLTRPMLRQDGELVASDWATALARTGRAFRRIIDEHGPHAVALYFGNPIAFNARASLVLPAFAEAITTAIADIGQVQQPVLGVDHGGHDGGPHAAMTVGALGDRHDLLVRFLDGGGEPARRGVQAEAVAQGQIRRPRLGLLEEMRDRGDGQAGGHIARVLAPSATTKRLRSGRRRIASSLWGRPPMCVSPAASTATGLCARVGSAIPPRV